MADQQTGVRPTEKTPTPEASKKNKRLLTYGGIGLAVLLLLSHRGSSAPGAGSGGSGAQSGQLLDAYQQGVQDASNVQGLGVGSTGVIGGAGDGNGGTQTGTTDGSTSLTTGSAPVSTPGPAAAVTVNVLPPPGTVANPSNVAAKGRGKSKHKGPGKPSAVQKHKDVTSTNTHPRAGTPHKTRPAPADHKGHHPETHKTTKRGHAKNSPVMVEAMDGSNSGITVMGRDFPGATGHRLCSPRRSPDGGSMRDVIVFYGGRTEVHTCGGNGDWWLDNTPGRNPLQNRTLPQVVQS